MRSFGQVGYEAYADSANWKNFSGGSIPDWSDVPPAIKAHWETAATAIVRYING